MHQQEVTVSRSENINLGQILKNSFIARSPSSLELLRQIRSLSVSTASVLITGESGSGKEMVAKLCHQNSEKAKGPFIAVNCAALPDGLLESELFGHQKGAFTGATTESAGLIRKANGGTLFLDEIGDMTLATQAKLLRVVQERTVRAVGGSTESPVDVRIICATHRNLINACEEGDFRWDLYYRLSVIPIFVPSLRDRQEDMMPLARHFMNLISTSQKRPPKGFSEEAKQKILSHNWPGNVRELNNVIERAMVYAKSSILTGEDIVFDIQHTGMNENSNIEKSTEDGSNVTPISKRTFKDVPVLQLRVLEKMAIESALENSKGVKVIAARKLGIDRKTLDRKTRKYKISC